MNKTNTLLSNFLHKQHFLPVFLGTVFLDQITKFMATLFGVQVSYNSGISFSVFANGNPQFLTFILILLVYLLYVNFKPYWQKNSLPAGLFFGGAVANIFDRLMFESVRDWLYIPFTQIQNNMADIAIFIGLVLLLQEFLNKRKTS